MAETKPVAPHARRFALTVEHTVWRGAAIAIAGLVLVAVPAFAGRAALQDFFFIFTMLALAQYWNLLAGYAGLVSVGQQAFVGVGAYTLFAATLSAGLDPLIAIALGGLVTAVIAVPTAFVVFQLRGAYFAIGTWVVAEIFRLVLAQVKQLGGGTGTSLGPDATNSMAGLKWIAKVFAVRTPAARDIALYYLALLLVAGTLALVFFFLRSRRGLSLAAIRDSEVAADSLGVDGFRTKLVVYVIAAFGTGLVGALIYLQKARVSPDAAFSVTDWTAFVIFIVVIGGIGTLEGPMVGAIVLYLLQDYLSAYHTWYLIALGTLAAAIMLIAPKGLWGFATEHLGWQLFPIRRRLKVD